MFGANHQPLKRASPREQVGDALGAEAGGSRSRSNSQGLTDGAATTSVSNVASTRSSGGRPKRTLIESACSACRRRKSRCDGVRPSCSRCKNLRTECQYEAEAGESRWSALRRQKQLLESERDQLKELMSFVQKSPEPVALEIFGRIRQGNYDDVFVLLQQLKDGSTTGSAPQYHPGITPPNETRLPPIQAILHGPAPPRPATLATSHSLTCEESRSSSLPDFSSQSSGLRTPLGTLEPSLTQPAPLLSLPSLSSEESTGSLSSTSQDIRSHFTPP